MKCKILILTSVLLVLAACASDSQRVADSKRYVFDDLEEVSVINDWRLDGWSEVDENALIVRTSPKTAYLLILSRPNYDLKFAQGIMVSTTAGNVEAKFDAVSTLRKKGVRYPIARIYKLEGRAQRNEVKARILGD